MISWIRKIFVNAVAQAQAERKLPKGFFSNSIPIDAAGEDGFQRIVPIGYFPNHPGGAHEITADNVRQMYDNFMRSAKSAILIDYEHRSLWGDTRAAGWSGAVDVRADGLYFKKPDWTPAAAEMIKNGEYRFFSPVYMLSASDLAGRQIGAKFISVGITNMPVFENEIDPIRNSESPMEDTDMKFTPEQRVQLIANHKLAAEATDEQIVEAIMNSRPLAETPAPGGGAPASGSDGAPAGATWNSGGAGAPLPEQFTALGTVVAGLVESVKSLVANSEKDRAKADGAMVDGWIREMRMLPADRQTVLNSLKADREGTIALYDGRPVGSCRPARVAVPAVKNAQGENGAKEKTWNDRVEDFRTVVNSAGVRAMVN